METGKKLKKIWVVLGGEQHEGGSVVGVFRKKKKAVEKALAQKTYFAGGWTQIACKDIENQIKDSLDRLAKAQASLRAASRDDEA